METTIKVTQIPVIKHELQIIGKGVSERIAALNIESQLATEDTVKALKEIRAELNKEATAFEAQRKDVKNAVMQPYNDFEAIYKAEIIDKFKAADDLLKSKISDFEMKIKSEKRTNLVDYFNEACKCKTIYFLTFDRMNIEVGLSVSEKKYKEQILEFIDKVAEDLALIETEQYAAEILIEYKKSLKANAAITDVRNRKEQERIEQERIQAREAQKQAQAAQAPKVEEQPIITKPVEVATKEETFVATFEVVGTHAELTALKNFLIENNYNYKNL